MKHDTKTYEQGLAPESADIDGYSSHKLQEEVLLDPAARERALKMERKIQAEKAKNDIRKFLIKEV